MRNQNVEEKRNNIIEQIWESNIVQKIVYSQMPKQGVQYETKIFDDVVQRVFLVLCKTPLEKLRELSNDKRYLTNYIGSVVKTQGLNNKYATSEVSKILTNSTMRNQSSIEDLTIDKQNDDVSDEAGELWESAKLILTKDEMNWLEIYLSLKKGQGKQKSYYQYYIRLLKKIKNHVSGTKYKLKKSEYNYQFTNEELERFKYTDRTKMSEARLKPVVQLTMEGEMVNRYESVQKAGESIGVSVTIMSHIINGRYNNKTGFKWEIEEAA